MDERLQEALLYAWMKMSVLIRGNRILTGFSFNEIMVCGLLARQEETQAPPLTATELCQQTKLLKSQVNHILADLEKRALITRARSSEDKRVVHLHLTEEGRRRYAEEHARVLEIVGAVRETLGSEKTRELTVLMAQATVIVNEKISNLSKEN